MIPRIRLYAGVDGGGTRCRVRLRDKKGTLIAEAEGGAANIHRDLEQALKTIHKTLEGAFHNAGLTDKDKSAAALGLGLAGLVSSDQAPALAHHFSDFAHCVMTSDAEIACLGANHGTDGGIVIAGTGSAGFGILRARRIAIGGRGFAIADDGSAARLGWEALRHALNAADGLALESPMTQTLMRRFEHDPSSVTRWTKTATPADYGRLAPIVFGFAEKGDVVATSLVKAAVDAVLALRNALIQQGIERVSLTGGMRDAILPWIALDHPDAFVAPLRDAADGAILFAGGYVP